MPEAFIFAGLRTPFGKHGGVLATIRPDDLAADLIATLVNAYPATAELVDEVVLGCANQAGEDSRNVARKVALLSGLPAAVGGLTVNRLCASGLAAIADAARMVRTGEAELVIAGGVESMSRAPFVLSKAERAFSRSIEIFDTALGTRFPNPRQTAAYGDHSMAETADNVAHELGIGRERSDAFALRSQQRYAAALAAGHFAPEIAAVRFLAGQGGAVIASDEQPRPQTTMEALAKLTPLHERGVVTAGSASGINDGAAVVFVGSEQAGRLAGLTPLARVVSCASAGIAPRVMGLGPVPAIRKLLSRTGLSLAEVDLIEINEAFACQVIGCLMQLGISDDDLRVNSNGGAIAVGHPLGASGARLVLTAAHALQRQAGRCAIVSLCVGVGQGLAALLERV